MKCGTTRCVFMLGRYALKLPRVDIGARQFLQGCLGNLNERYWWNLGRGTYAEPLLCPVLSCGPLGAWLVMPRASRDGKDGIDALIEPTLTAMDERLEGADTDADWGGHNLGWYDNRLVLLDYGNLDFGFNPEAFPVNPALTVEAKP